MEDEDRSDYVNRYEAMLSQHGYSPRSLGWGEHGRQHIRFSVLAEYALKNPGSSVLDVGCGFADLFDFLVQAGWKGQYTGVDMVPGLVQVARKRHPSLDLRVADITGVHDIPPHDHVISCGALNARLPSGKNLEHIQAFLGALFRLSRITLSLDFLSSFVDFQQSQSWHTEPAWAIQEARRLTRRWSLRHDYLPFEFALFLFSDQAISEEKAFYPMGRRSTE